ncbi:MAG: hypothetical protein EBT03_08425 [Betaproteobacteria bacterium]|nr:hypothetical protein [Betaproteobacteria bacterium]
MFEWALQKKLLIQRLVHEHGLAETLADLPNQGQHFSVSRQQHQLMPPLAQLAHQHELSREYAIQGKLLSSDLRITRGLADNLGLA